MRGVSVADMIAAGLDRDGEYRQKLESFDKMSNIVVDGTYWICFDKVVGTKDAMTSR